MENGLFVELNSTIRAKFPEKTASGKTAVLEHVL
jgi:hypothetical protein